MPFLQVHFERQKLNKERKRERKRERKESNIKKRKR